MKQFFRAINLAAFLVAVAGGAYIIHLIRSRARDELAAEIRAKAVDSILAKARRDLTAANVRTLAARDSIEKLRQGQVARDAVIRRQEKVLARLERVGDSLALFSHDTTLSLTTRLGLAHQAIDVRTAERDSARVQGSRWKAQFEDELRRSAILARELASWQGQVARYVVDLGAVRDSLAAERKRKDCSLLGLVKCPSRTVMAIGGAGLGFLGGYLAPRP